MTGLGTLGGNFSAGNAINLSGPFAESSPRTNDGFRVSEDNEMVVRDGLFDGHKQLGMNLNLSVAASPAGTPTSSPGDVPQYVAVQHQTLPQLLGGRAPSTPNHPT